MDGQQPDNHNYMGSQNNKSTQQEPNRRVPVGDNSQQEMHGYSNNRRPEQDSQPYPRRIDNAQVDVNQRMQIDNMQQDSSNQPYARRSGLEDNQMFMPNRRLDNQDNHNQSIRKMGDDTNVPVPPGTTRKVDGSENHNTIIPSK